MPKPYDFGEIHLDVTAGRERRPQAIDPGAPFRIAILGDFSGRANHSRLEPLAGRKAILIDRDNFDQVLAKMSPALELAAAGGPRLALAFSDLDDFHPDRLFERLPIFAKLRETRQRLADPATFKSAAAELAQGGSGSAAPATRPSEPLPQRPVARPDAAALASGSLLDNVLDESISETEQRGPEARPARAPDELREFVRRVVAPHLVAGADPRQPELLAKVDQVTSESMRVLLHHPEFQALEAAWRAICLLVRRIETDEQLKLYLVDISKDELAHDLSTSADLRQTGAYRLLAGPTQIPGAEPWTVVAGNYAFDASRKDAELLGRLAKIAKAAGAPLLAEADPAVVELAAGVQGEAADAWRALRGLPEAVWVGLALPRFLLRLPYGQETDSAERFDFEEMPGEAPGHQDYLWANPAFACTLLLAQAFSDYGWTFRPGVHSEISGLPLHLYREDGEAVAKPCAEILLTESAAEEILESGVMPLVSIKGRDVVRLLRFQSIADPLTRLGGRWG